MAADKIKGFISKKFIDAKFKLAGSGKKLNETAEVTSTTSNVEPASRSEPTEEAKRAGLAALSRIASTSTCDSKPLPLKLKKPLKNLDEIGNASGQSDSMKAEHKNEAVSRLASETSHVFFRCPLIGPEILSRDEWMLKIKSYINELILTENNPNYLSLLIKSVNDPAKAEFACEKLKICLQNILDHPTEEKYKKIKVMNPLFKDKLLPIEGSEKFLLSAGFKYNTLDDIEYLIYPEDQPDSNLLTEFIEALQSTDPIQLSLDRNIKVFQGYRPFDLNKEADSFFQLSSEELKFEATRRRDQLEDMKILKTKAMREREIYRPVYEYTNIRIKFPDGVYIQGTFAVNETVNDVHQFVLEYLKSKSESFNLSIGLGQYINKDKSLLEEKLVPAALLYFEWHKEENAETNGYLTNEILVLMSTV